MAAFQFVRTQKVNATIDEIWDFISSPMNLKEITPDYMGFEVTSPNLPKRMYAGMIISYKVSPLLGIKMHWLTEITQVKKKEFFIDEQRIGPYRMWHHQHHLIPIKNGVLMRDIVTYVPPFGWIGVLANKWMIRKKLNQIFDYRENKVNQIFGSFQPESDGLVKNVI
jgi:ligand-binding SRPBCC domain-containing protein